jgi:hypothetical protein
MKNAFPHGSSACLYFSFAITFAKNQLEFLFFFQYFSRRGLQGYRFCCHRISGFENIIQFFRSLLQKCTDLKVSLCKICICFSGDSTPAVWQICDILQPLYTHYNVVEVSYNDYSANSTFFILNIILGHRGHLCMSVLHSAICFSLKTSSKCCSKMTVKGCT